MNSALKLTLRENEEPLVEQMPETWESVEKHNPEQFIEIQPSGEDAKKFITAEQAANYLGGRFTEGAIRMKTHRKEIPHFKFGSIVYFTKETLENWKDKHFVPPKLGS